MNRILLALVLGLTLTTASAARGQTDGAANEFWAAYLGTVVSLQGCVLSHHPGPCDYSQEWIGRADDLKSLMPESERDAISAALRSLAEIAARVPTQPIPENSPYAVTSGPSEYPVASPDDLAIFASLVIQQERAIRGLRGG